MKHKISDDKFQTLKKLAKANPEVGRVLEAQLLSSMVEALDEFHDGDKKMVMHNCIELLTRAIMDYVDMGDKNAMTEIGMMLLVCWWPLFDNLVEMNDKAKAYKTILNFHKPAYKNAFDAMAAGDALEDELEDEEDEDEDAESLDPHDILERLKKALGVDDIEEQTIYKDKNCEVAVGKITLSKKKGGKSDGDCKCKAKCKRKCNKSSCDCDED